jgi:hypothetical protein
MIGQLKQERLSLSSRIDDLEIIAEVRPLTTQEIDFEGKKCKVPGLLGKEELKWCQIFKAQFPPERDLNKKYFHSIVNGKHGKKLINYLDHDEGTIEGHEQLKSYITSYYKGLYGVPEVSDVSLDESRIDDIPQASPEENVILGASLVVTEKVETKKTVIQSSENVSLVDFGIDAE